MGFLLGNLLVSLLFLAVGVWVDDDRTRLVGGAGVGFILLMLVLLWLTERH